MELEDIKNLAQMPIRSEADMGMVEIIMLNYNDADMVAKTVPLIIQNSNYPFKLTVYNTSSQNVPLNFSKQWNKLIKESTCPYVLIMDSDVFVPEDWLKRMMETFEKEPECEVVVCLLDKTSGPQQIATQPEPYPTYQKLTSILAAQLVLYKKTVFEKVGYFDERFLLYGQDSEWGYRFLKTNTLGFVRRDVLCHHVGSYSLNKLAETELYDAGVERIYARELFKFLKK